LNFLKKKLKSKEKQVQTIKRGQPAKPAKPRQKPAINGGNPPNPPLMAKSQGKKN